MSDRDPIDPSHYRTTGPPCAHCGETVECITVTRRMGFALGNAIKYLWRAGKKPGTSEAEDLRKARWYIDDRLRQIEEGATEGDGWMGRLPGSTP